MTEKSQPRQTFWRRRWRLGTVALLIGALFLGLAVLIPQYEEGAPELAAPTVADTTDTIAESPGAATAEDGDAETPEQDQATPEAATADGLTGIGATRDSWVSEREPDPFYDDDCCFLPYVDGQPRYYAALWDEGRIIGYSIRQAPPLPADAAIALLEQEELPSDAELVTDTRLPLCRTLQYHSQLFAEATGNAGISVNLYSSSGDEPFTGEVREILLFTGMQGDAEGAC